ncbi:hypothetical protein, partial [Klebsiella pneumoniae]|uniref:hypothetical protein n=1 Tax=Klebsiella pneumoniae TaxID=573 RepID=UPI003EE179BD
KKIQNLNLYDKNEPAAEYLIEKAKKTEELALSNKLITNSKGANAGYYSSKVAFATSKGFNQTYQTSGHSLSLSILAGKD